MLHVGVGWLVFWYLNVVDEAIQALHLAVGPPRDPEFSALLLQHGEADLELLGGLGDRHVEVLGELLECYLIHSLTRPSRVTTTRFSSSGRSSSCVECLATTTTTD